MILNSGMSLSFFAVVGTVPGFSPFKFADQGKAFYPWRDAAKQSKEEMPIYKSFYCVSTMDSY